MKKHNEHNEYFKLYIKNKPDINKCYYTKKQLKEFEKHKLPITCTEYFDDV